MHRSTVFILVVAAFLVALPIATASFVANTSGDKCQLGPEVTAQHSDQATTQSPKPADAVVDETWVGLFYRQLKNSFENQFIGGSLILTITGGIMAIVYNLYVEVRQYINDKLYITVAIAKNQEIYHWMTNWLVKHEVVQRSSHFAATTNLGQDNDDYYESTATRRKLATVSFLPVGTKTTYKVLFKTTLIWVSIEAEGELSVGGGVFFSGGGRSSPPTDNKGYTLRTFNMDGTGRQIIGALLNEAQLEYNKRSESTVEMFMARYGAWERIGCKPHRRLESVILNGNQAERILADAREFLAEGQWYGARGIPHRRGYLLFGPPGCGKTSFITALAGELQLPLCMISLSDPSTDGYTFTRLMNTAPESAIIVLEDVDAAFVSRGKSSSSSPPSGINSSFSPEEMSDNEKKSEDKDDHESLSDKHILPAAQDRTTGEGAKLSFSDLLNGLDGLAAQEGRLLFMTTNHRGKLDPALIRPGRIDLQLEFALATQAQAERLFKHFYGDFQAAPQGAAADIRESQQEIAQLAQTFVQSMPDSKFSMATIQGYLMRYRRTPRDAVANVGEFVALELATMHQNKS